MFTPLPLKALVLSGLLAPLALMAREVPPAPPADARIEWQESQSSWSLRTGPVELRLKLGDGGLLALDYFGPAGEPSWAKALPRLRNYARFDLSGQVDGQFLRPEDLTLTSHEIIGTQADQPELVLRYRHRHIPLEIVSRYVVRGNTGVITRQITLLNRGPKPLAMEKVPSLAWLLPPGDYTLNYLHGGWGEERQLTAEKIGVGVREFVNRTGRSTNGQSAWFCLENEAQGLRYAAQLAYSGNWGMSFQHYTERRNIPLSGQDLWVELGMRFDFGAAAPLAAGQSFALPEVAFTVSAGDLNDIANQMHRYHRRYVMPHTPLNVPLMTQLNTFEPLGRSPHVKDLKRYVDHAAELGLECMGTDASWVVKTKAGETLYGDWREDPIGFPNGLKELADYVHAKGMKFSVWLEPESVSKNSPIALQHPEWILKHNGVPMQGTRDRVYIDYRREDVRKWMRDVVDHLVKNIGVEWLKLDYNADVGDAFDPAGSGERTGTLLYDHLRNYYAWLDEIRRDYPTLIIENCSSGALRFDLGLLAKTHFSWRSDITTPRASMQLTYGSTLEFPAEASYHWMSGDDQRGNFNPSTPRGWWDFALRADMNGLFGIGGRVDDWTPEMKACAKENIVLYKRIREVIQGGDLYRHTPPPAAGERPTGWMTLQYVSPDAQRSVVMAYRLADSPAQQTYRLRGLSSALTYEVLIDGKPPATAQLRTYTGRELANAGLSVALDAEWRCAVIELKAVSPAAR
jgi:alpha-galactosidase